MPMIPVTRLLFLVPVMLQAACSSTLPPVRTVEHVNLERFMGDWYVIASIPTFIEKDAYNAVESYTRISDRRIATTFRFNQGSFDGPLKTYEPTGYVSEDPSNAVWGMQFIWPVKADYRVMYLSDDYTHTVIGRNRRDYVWIMARTPGITDAEYDSLVARIAAAGYETSKLRRVPQQHATTGSLRP
jgi:apolipoprotein D and lipocalin family protein